MVQINVIDVLSLVFLFKTAAAINACPVADTVFTGTQGIRYRICPGTDLSGRSAKVTQNVASATACAQLCDKTADCLKAVYDNQGRSCHFKGMTNLAWVPNARFNVIQVEQVNIARCPYPETTVVRNGKTFKVCRDTDFRGGSQQFIKGVKSINDCAQLCSTNKKCERAVFDSVTSACHIKSDARTDTLIWSTDKRYDVIRLDVPAAPAINGAWSDLIRLPVIPVAAYIVPEFPESNRMLVFSSWGADAFGGPGGLTQFADYNFKTGAVSARSVANTKHDMFCPGISALEDGRILIQGGSDAKKNTFYDPKTNAFTPAPDLIMARGYQSSSTLSDGRVFTIGGAYSGPRQGKDGEVYDPKTNAWKALPGAKNKPMLTTDREGIWREDNHAWLFSWKKGSVFQAGPSKAMNWYTANGAGTQVAAGVRDPIDDAMCGIFVMYEPGKILTAGGSPDYTNSNANARSHLISIDKVNEPAKVERGPDMAYPRGFSNAVVLPDGTVLVTGGQRRSLVFTDTDGILWAELYNPATKSWRTLAAEAVPRNYHSVSILLADGRVFSGGGGLCWAGARGRSTVECNKLVDHADGQTFSPPYLFNKDGSAAARPNISTLSATSVRVGGTLRISTSTANPKFVLVRIGTVTHSVNTDQRRVPLTNITARGGEYTATLPNDSGILIPGHYYLFVLNAAGTPSMAKTVKITL